MPISIQSQKWILHSFISIFVIAAILFLLYLSGAPALTIKISAALLAIVFALFTFIAIRHFLTHPYSLAAALVRSMARGHYELHSPKLEIHEADDLMNALDELAKSLQGQAVKMQQLERMRTDFVANVSHELKTPLTSVKGYAETIQSDPNMSPETRTKFLSRIEENAQRMIAIISDLLALSQMDSFPQAINWQVFDSRELAQKLDGLFMPALKEKNQSLKLEFDDKQLEGDPQKLEQLLTNLIGNANRYCANGSRIDVKQTKTNRHWVLEVKDNGNGIPKEHQARVFERFYRVDAARSRETGGTGLGLAIVKHIALLHDGTVTLESENGAGSKFHIQWPRRQL
jgi:signal transduction histidine kinase